MHIIVFILLILTPYMGCWDLDHLVPDRAAIAGVVVWESRAFLAIPRLWRDPRISVDDPVFSMLRQHNGSTLVESSWPEPKSRTASYRWRFRNPEIPRAFPGISQQVIGDCTALQSVIGVAVDHLRGRLWVLDTGKALRNCSYCAPRVVVYNLRTNQESMIRPLTGISGCGLSGFALDAPHRRTDRRAYVGYPMDGCILVVSWKKKSWWKLRLSAIGAGVPILPHPPDTHDIPRWEMTTIDSTRRPRLVISAGDSDILYDIFLSDLRRHPPIQSTNVAKDFAALVPIHRLGQKLGRSSSIFADSRGSLYYFLVRDEAVVRWDPVRAHGAEGHDILLQDPDKVPLVGGFFSDSNNNVWAVVATFNEMHEVKGGVIQTCNCTGLLSIQEGKSLEDTDTENIISEEDTEMVDNDISSSDESRFSDADEHHWDLGEVHRRRRRRRSTKRRRKIRHSQEGSQDNMFLTSSSGQQDKDDTSKSYEYVNYKPTRRTHCVLIYRSRRAQS